MIFTNWNISESQILQTNYKLKLTNEDQISKLTQCITYCVEKTAFAQIRSALNFGLIHGHWLNLDLPKENTSSLPWHEFGYKVLILSWHMDFKDTLSLADNVFTAFGSVCRLGVCMYTVSNSISGLFLKSFMREYRPCQTLARGLVLPLSGSVTLKS